ncbi:MAG: hypothetical protein F4Z31_07340 [Gemmatimonadetes bacterium]|nr:hypothetical protein [Gemmatimonadota bacterium]MYA41548.1 hypothetical protein [Gemmatimonadota bacterium]MYF07803.1 hypothetical protein [Rhodospirillaceae bacterium]
MERLPVSVRLAVATVSLLATAVCGAAANGQEGANSDSADDVSPHIRATAAALAVARGAVSLATTASVRTRAETTSEAMAESKASIDAHATEMRRQIDLLASAGYEEVAGRMRGLLDDLTLNARRIEDGRQRVARILHESQSRRQELIAATSWQLLPAALVSEDDLFYSMVSSTGDAEAQASRTARAVSVEDLLLYVRLALMIQQVDQGYIALEVTTRLPDSEFMATLEENAHMAMYQLRENIESLANVDHDHLAPGLLSLARDLLDAAYGEANLIDLMKTRFRLTDQEERLAAAVASVSASLRSEADAALEQAIGTLELMDATAGTARALRAVLAVKQHASAAARHAAGQTTANTPLADLPGIRVALAGHISGMRQALDTLEDLGYGAALARLYPEIDRLDSVTERILNGRPELAAALHSVAQRRAELRSLVDYHLDPAVVSSLDNQLYYMLTGRSEFRDVGIAGSDPLSQVEFLRYWHLASAYNSLFRTFSGLVIAIIMTEPTLIGEGEERFITASHRLERSIEALDETGGPELAPNLVALARQFMSFGHGESNVFDSLRHRLPLIASENGLLEAAQQIGSGLQAGADAILDSILADASS